jgi:PLP dependent protein
LDEMKKQNRFQPCFIQINTGREPQKAGIAPESTADFLALCRRIGLNIVGLMGIPPIDAPPEPHFRLLKTLADTQGLTQLSMGMSDDYPAALACGATHIRIGSALFGART